MAKFPGLYSRFDGPANPTGKGNAHDCTAFGQVAYTITGKIKRMYALGVNAGMLLEGESGGCTCEGRIAAPDKVEVFNASCVQLLCDGAERPGQALELLR